MGKHNPPQSTRTLHSKDREVASDFFDADRRVKLLDPTPEQFEIVLRAAVAMTAYDGSPGRSPRFPSAEDFVDDYLGIKHDWFVEDVPPDKRRASTEMLKLSLRLNEDLAIEHADEVCVRCPVCEEETAVCKIGTLPEYKDGELVPSSKPRMIALNLECDCTGYGTGHYQQIERMAVYEYVT